MRDQVEMPLNGTDTTPGLERVSQKAPEAPRRCLQATNSDERLDRFGDGCSYLGHLDDDFDWSTDESVVIQEQPRTAVYTNKWGQIVIKQERAWNEETDPYVRFNAESAGAVVTQMLLLLEDLGTEACVTPWQLKRLATRLNAAADKLEGAR